MKEYVIEELKGSNGGIMRFDFMIEIDKRMILIEYDGIQHYIQKFGEKEFRRIQDNDRLKNDDRYDYEVNIGESLVDLANPIFDIALDIINKNIKNGKENE